MPPPSATISGVSASKRPALYQSAAGVSNSPFAPNTTRKRPSAGILTTTTTAAGTRTARITTTATACPDAAATPLSRHPLRLRDQNAAPALRAVKPSPESRSHSLMATRMPSYERASVAGNRQPAVARVVNKQPPKPPLTPKIAARPAAPQPYPNPTLATPLPRRPAPDSVLSANGTGARDKDELLTSPVSAFLAHNITPRSGSRQSRVDSANGTPNGTPIPDRHDQWETRSGLSIADDVHRRPMVTFSSPPLDAGLGGLKQDRDSKFFYASDAQKLLQQATLPRPTVPQQQKSPTFFYANGNTVPERPTAGPGPLSPLLASPSSNDGLMSKFIYANGVPELQPSAKIGPSPHKKSGSVVSTASRLPTSKQGNGARPVSPIKPPPHTVTKTGSGSAVGSSRSSGSSATNLQSNGLANHGRANADLHRRQATLVKTHVRTKSAAVAEPLPPAKLLATFRSVPSSGSTSPTNPPHPLSSILPNNPTTAGFASLLQAAEDFAEADDAKSDETKPSPTKTSQDGQLTDLVANARRERKVQDLQITNASLEAINRTLERQLRKQTAEIRRFQRLSRSGRLSMGSMMGSRIPSDSTVDGTASARAGIDLDDLSEEESDVEAEKAESKELDEDDDMSSSEASGELSPSAVALNDTKHRGRDERRLRLDLTQHHQLLVDSQKINQSLKRCLGWTEELINEGKRALEYRVRPSDVALGGRVLAPEEVERREAGSDVGEVDREAPLYGIGLPLDGVGIPDTEMSSAPWSQDPQDRDSGIALPADGEGKESC
ncbi:hypothetical protein BT67DRAFT_237288 [Trichocladium antarcticum]|uniref:Uncharacterized protein n=1 Tax=Trichocladium antarcticum TaxID=1450529 RepID=A0AAN6UNZ5_9PEZI|nr:hypothetical protein BT67DRAFT_237288 [Trichocladium antarcticum]